MWLIPRHFRQIIEKPDRVKARAASRIWQGKFSLAIDGDMRMRTAYARIKFRAGGAAGGQLYMYDGQFRNGGNETLMTTAVNRTPMRELRS